MRRDDIFSHFQTAIKTTTCSLAGLNFHWQTDGSDRERVSNRSGGTAPSESSRWQNENSNELESSKTGQYYINKQKRATKRKTRIKEMTRQSRPCHLYTPLGDDCSYARWMSQELNTAALAAAVAAWQHENSVNIAFIRPSTFFSSPSAIQSLFDHPYTSITIL